MGCVIQSNDDDDDHAIAACDSSSKDDAGPRDKEGNGRDASTNECSVTDARYVRNVDKFMGRWSSTVSEEESPCQTAAAKMKVYVTAIFRVLVRISGKTESMENSG